MKIQQPMRVGVFGGAFVLVAAASAAAQVSLLKVLGVPDEDDLGTSVSAIGDVNGDGRADFVVGVPGADGPVNNAGAARVVSGLDGSTLLAVTGIKNDDRLGNSVAGGGDIDADGFPDFVAGSFSMNTASAMTGGARVVSGATGNVLYTVHGDSPNDFLGMTVAMIGDVNGDGFGEVAAGAPYDDNTGTDTGSVRVFAGPSGGVLYTVNGTHADGGFGRALAGIGDASGDGIDDFAVGAPNATSGAPQSGLARIISGATGLTHLFLFGGTFEGVGRSLALAGDYDDDGRADVLVGTSLNVVKLRSGTSGAVLQSYAGGTVGDFFGFACSLAGDFDGDGNPDVVVGAMNSDLNGDDSGAAFVFSGPSATLLQTYRGSNAFEDFGTSVAGIGDVNFDGRADLAIGAPDAILGGASVFVGLPASCINAPGSVDLNVDGVPDACQFCQSNLAAGGPGNMHLQICGDPLTFTGSVTTLGVSKGTPYGILLLLAATGTNPTPAFGGTIWPLPVVAMVPGTFDAQGSWRLQIPGGPSGPVNVYLQTIAPWPGGPSLYEISGPTLLKLGY